MPGARVALLSIGQATRAPGEGPRALVPLLGGSVISYQADRLRAAGIDRFLIAVEEVPGAATQLADRLRASGATVQFLRAPAELAAHVQPDDHLLAVAEGLYCDGALIAEFANLPPDQVAVVDDMAESAGFERIDINHRWAGLAVVEGRIATELTDLPPDWSIESALMRQALRRGAGRVTIAAGQLLSGAVRVVGSAASAGSVESRMLDSAAAAQGGGPIERRIFAPLARLALPRLWRWRSADMTLAAAPPLLGGLTLLATWMGFPVIGSLLGLAALLSRAVMDARGRMAGGVPGGQLATNAMLVLLGLALVPYLAGERAIGWPDLAPAAMLAGLIAAAILTRVNEAWHGWKPGLPEFALLLSCGAIAGYPAIGGWTAAFLALAVVLGERMLDLRDTRLTAN